MPEINSIRRDHNSEFRSLFDSLEDINHAYPRLAILERMLDLAIALNGQEMIVLVFNMLRSDGLYNNILDPVRRRTLALIEIARNNLD